jgi:hypothetical protein
MNLINKVLDTEKPDCMVLFTDPHQYHNIWINASFIRDKMPIYFIHVWDTYMMPTKGGKYHYNQPILENCDGIGCISKQTEWMVNEIFNKSEFSNKPYIHYVGHGSDPDVYKPLKPEEYKDVEDKLFKGKHYEYVALMVNNNQHRKKMADFIEAWRIFFDELPQTEQAKCALVLHTKPITTFGLNLNEVIQALAPNRNIHLSIGKESEETLNKLYNLASVVVNVSNAEGFGLCANEAALAGKCTIVNATGGLVDQCGYTIDGKPMPWTLANKNNLKNIKHGDWCYTTTNNRTIIGNPGNGMKAGTHYLYDENCSIDDIAAGLKYWGYMSRKDQDAKGLINREFALANGLNSKDFSKKVVEGITKTIDEFKPQPLVHIYKV